jgi:hypothetical protein
MLVDTTPIAGALKELRPIELQQVRRTGDEPLFNSLMEQHHYLKYEQPVGEHLKYLAWAQGRPIACLAWSSAPRHLGSRDRYIGAGVGDLFMSLIHTCELNGANPFDYLTESLRHAEELKRSPSEWMTWNYRETLARLGTTCRCVI